jgi:hypothetical protein
MNKQTARNVLVVLGMWTLSQVIAWVLKVLVAVVNNRTPTFTGDVGTVTMWLWLGIPDTLVAGVAAIALMSVIETKNSLSWVGTFAALYLYGGSLNAWRVITHGLLTPPSTPDYVGIVGQAIIPALACLVVGVWMTRRSAARRPAAT